MTSPHPRREDYASEMDYWIICALRLDRLFPARREIREMSARQTAERTATR